MVRDLYAEKDMGEVRGQFTALVPPHDVCVVKITPKFVRPEYNAWRPWHKAVKSSPGSLVLNSVSSAW